MINIKIGFNDSTREVTFNTDEEKDTVEGRLREAIGSEQKTVDFVDDKGRSFIVRQSAIAYVEVGSPTNRTVGFTS